MEQTQYLNEEILLKHIGILDIKPTDLGSTDTYNEGKILENYLKFDEKTKTLIYKAALQLAIIGYGNKNYGFIRIDDQQTITLEELFSNCKIKFNERQNEKYGDSELSARRLIRLFRLQISNFITKNNRPSYLYLKYAPTKSIEYMNICFPGGEHLLKSPQEAAFLYQTYSNLDKMMSTKFCVRLQRVFIARGILAPDYFIAK